MVFGNRAGITFALIITNRSATPIFFDPLGGKAVRNLELANIASAAATIIVMLALLLSIPGWH